MEAHKLTESQFRLLGILPLAFFAAQAVHYWQINELGHTLWMCNIGNLLLALGLFLEQAMLIRVAVIWLVPGVAVWLAYVVPSWGILLSGGFSYSGLFGVVSSTLAHLGGCGVGLVALRKVRVDRRAWLYAFMWYFIVQLLSRLVTPAAMNINVAHHVQAGWEQTFSSYWKFWLVLTTLIGLGLWLLARLLGMFWPRVASAEDAAAPGL